MHSISRCAFRVRGCTNWLRRLLLAFLLAAMPLPGVARTFQVLDTATDLPLEGVEISLVARGTLPGVGHPIEITLRRWDLTTDRDGKITISPPWAERAHVESMAKRGYGSVSSAKEYRMQRSGPAFRDIRYLTPLADINVEYIAYLFHIGAEAMEKKEGLAGLPPIMNIAVLYDQAKARGTGERERAVLRAFCRFAGDMKVQGASGWPDMGTRPEPRQSGQALIDDCESGRP